MKKVISWLVFLFSFLMIINLFKNILRLNKAKDRIKLAQKRLEAARDKNQQLKEKKEYYQSEEFFEEEVRNKLGMVKPEEVVAILPEIKNDLNKKEEFLFKTEDAKPLSNWQKWYYLFFAN